MKTVGDFLKSGIIDIKPLLTLALKKTTAQLYADSDYSLSKAQHHHLMQLVQERQQGKPFAYLSGEQAFYHLSFKVNRHTLIPRPETELLIDIALDLLDKKRNYQVLDLGTGSGIIAITLADICKNWQLTATDFSLKALAVAKQNANTEINFLLGEWFAPLTQKFDLIISNPPYIKANDPCLNDLRYEPKSALVAGKDGLDAIRIISKNAHNYLHKNGFLLLEHGFDQQKQIKQLLKCNFCNVRTFTDYNLNDRAILAQIK